MPEIKLIAHDVVNSHQGTLMDGRGVGSYHQLIVVAEKRGEFNDADAGWAESPRLRSRYLSWTPKSQDIYLVRRFPPSQRTEVPARPRQQAIEGEKLGERTNL